jgi:uncharacterized membrane protein
VNNYLKIVAAMLIWSTWGIMIRWLSLPPFIVLFYTALIASVAVPLVLKARGEFTLEGVGTVWPLFTALALSSIINNLTYFYALAHTTISNAVFTHYTAPVFVAVLAPFLITERLQRVTMISLPLAIAGMVLIVMAGDGLRLGEEPDDDAPQGGRCAPLDHRCWYRSGRFPCRASSDTAGRSPFAGRRAHSLNDSATSVFQCTAACHGATRGYPWIY